VAVKEGLELPFLNDFLCLIVPFKDASADVS
jgi:hypothetical protein